MELGSGLLQGNLHYKEINCFALTSASVVQVSSSFEGQLNANENSIVLNTLILVNIGLQPVSHGQQNLKILARLKPTIIEDLHAHSKQSWPLSNENRRKVCAS